MPLFRLVVTAALLAGCSLAPPPRTWTDPPASPLAVPIAVRTTGGLRGHVEFALARHPVRLVAQDADADLVVNGELLIDGQPATTLVLFIGRSDRTIAVQLSASDHAFVSYLCGIALRDANAVADARETWSAAMENAPDTIGAALARRERSHLPA